MLDIYIVREIVESVLEYNYTTCHHRRERSL